jgi:hypothetical protein
MSSEHAYQVAQSLALQYKHMSTGWLKHELTDYQEPVEITEIEPGVFHAVFQPVPEWTRHSRSLVLVSDNVLVKGRLYEMPLYKADSQHWVSCGGHKFPGAVAHWQLNVHSGTLVIAIASPRTTRCVHMSSIEK